MSKPRDGIAYQPEEYQAFVLVDPATGLPYSAAPPPATNPSLSTESTQLLVKSGVDLLNTGVNNVISSIGGTTAAVNAEKAALQAALAPLTDAATEATLAQANTALQAIKVSSAAAQTALAALQADSATMVGRIFNNHATQLIPAATTVSIPAGAWKSLSVLFLPTTLGASINGASFDGMSLTNPNLASYTGEYTATTSATTLVTIVTGNCEARVLRMF